MRTTRTAVSLAVVVMMVLVSAAVMISSSADEAAPEMADISAVTDGYVRVGLVSPVVNWNPLTAEMEEDYMMTSLIYSSLFTYDEDWGGPVNDLATEWYQEVDPVDNSMTTYITITHHSYFNDLDNLTGTSHQLTAQDVEFTFNLIKSEYGYTYDWYLQEITVLGTANATGTGSFQDQIQLWTPYPKATLIDDIASIPILPMYLWESYSYPFGGMQPSQLVGSGPFVFEAWLKDVWHKFKTAPNYHGSLTHPGEDRTVDINGLLYTVYGGGDPLCVAVNEGIEDVVAITGYTQAFLNILGNQASVNVYKAAVSEMGICDVAINAIPPEFYEHEGGMYGAGNPVLLDPFVRQAIMMTLNKPYICDVLLHGLAVRGSSVIQPGYWQADIDEMPFDPDAARDLLLSHGWSADADGDGFLEATASAYAVQMGYVDVGTELSGIRCQAPDTDKTYEYVALSWKGEAAKAGIQFDPCGAESEMTMINQAWYNCDYDIWVWHWGWGPEPIGGALTVWLTELIKKGGDNCQMPMGEWWYGWNNYTEAPTIWSGRGETIEYTLEGPYSSFDQNISIALETLDKAERKVILDELQQVIYDSYCENPPFYDLGLYGFTDYRFTNWGDFEAHPGRAFTSALCWLWFDLVPAGANQMPVFDTPLLPSYDVEVGVPITFTIGVSDSDGDPIGVNWSFGDGDTYSQYIDGDTTVERFTSATHVYTETATDLTLTVAVNDYPQHTYETIATAQVDVFPLMDQAPEILNISYDPESALVGEEVAWTAWAMDHEQGPDGYGLEFHWDWDDGTTANSYIQPVANDTPVADTQGHVWTEAGTYSVKLNVIDGPNNVSVTIPYTVVAEQAGGVSYQWHGMFDHEFGSWMEERAQVYINEWAVTDSYPYIYMKEGPVPGDATIYTFMRLGIDGQDLPELSMNSNPEFLPLLGDAEGGTAEIDWHMDYITREEGEARLSPTVMSSFDGWYIALNGTVSLDEQAAKAVLGITSGEFDDFDAWWAANQDAAEESWRQWMIYEGRDRLDIYPMYDWVLTFLYFDLDAAKTGDEIVVSMDTISWGMEALMTRWLHEAFMPTEWYMEDMNLHAVIGPERADVDIDAAVAYSVFAYESALDGTPCWAWQAMLQDYVPSSPSHPYSMFDPYVDLEQMERSPSSIWTGAMVPYDYTPGAWDLSENETLSFEWPDGEVLFFAHDEGNTAGLIDNTAEFWSEMTVKYSEPDAGDAPGQVIVDQGERTITFEGPFDMLTWSEQQAEHEWLADEWDRLGVLPYGVPYIEFAPADVNHQPNASFTVTPDAGPVGTVFTFDASSSYDLEDPTELLRVQWDWNGDGVWDTSLSTDKVVGHQYGAEGVYTVFLRVVDTDGLEGQTVGTVNVFAAGTCIPITEGTSVTIYEQTGEVHAYTFSIDDLVTTNASFSTVAMLSETYYLTVYGDYLAIECYREPPYPTTGTGTGDNIVAVRLDGVAGYPDGLWATTILGYSIGSGGIAESRWNALGPADQIGPYGDSLCTYLGDYYSDIVLGWSVQAVTIDATIDIDKDRINLARKGGWITAYIELPEGYDVADINITTVCIEGAVFADVTTWSIGDYDSDGIADLKVTFDREGLPSVLDEGDEVAVTISGALLNGTPFEGSDVVKVVNSKTEVMVATTLGVTLGSVNLGILTVVAIALTALAAIGASDRIRRQRSRVTRQPMRSA